VIEDGRAMLVMGGLDANHYGLNITQIVRPGHSTQPGPNMTGWAYGHCSTTLQDGSVISMGGARPDNFGGSARTEVYNFTTKQWRQAHDMRQRRLYHSCTQVWVTPDNPEDDILAPVHTNNSVISIVVAGGNYTKYISV
jgi:hypothetical protein